MQPGFSQAGLWDADRVNVPAMVKGPILFVSDHLPSPHLSISETKIDLFETKVTLCVPDCLEVCGSSASSLLSAGLTGLHNPLSLW